MNDQDIRPRRTCDVVMKGGITSGVVYPQAITTLAKRYTFKNIGGTSAGAIAAAAAAAAEYRRQFLNSDAGFKALEGLPALLGEKPGGVCTRLFLFFQPNATTSRIFQVLTGGLGAGAEALPAMLSKVIAEYAVWALLGALPGLALGILSGAELYFGALAWLWLLVSFLMLLAGTALGAVFGFARDFIREVPRNGYGLCSGLSDTSDPTRAAGNAPAEPLTN